MSITFMGAEMSAFTPSDSTVVEHTLAGQFNSSFARCALYTNNSTNYAEGNPSASMTTAWMHFDMAIRGGSNNSLLNSSNTRWVWYDSGGTARIRIVQNYFGTTTTLQYDIGSGWVTVGSALSLDLGAGLQTIDINVVCNTASGSIVLYIAGTERLNSGTINLSAITALKKFRFFGATVSGVAYYTSASQVICATEPTIGWRLGTRYPNGAGATSTWGGAYTDIDETVYSDADFIYSPSANQVSTFTQTGPSLSGYVVRAVAVSARAKKGASGPTQISHVLRVSGTDYAATAQALGTGYGPFQNIWEQNPATTADWLNAAISSLEPGVKSIA